VLNGGETSWWLNLNNPMIGYEGGVSTFPAQAINRIAATDGLSTVGVDSAAEISVKTHNISTGVMTTGAHSLKAGRLLVASDCGYSTLFQMTGPAGTGLTTVNHAASGSPGNCYLGLGRSCSETQENHEFASGAILTPLSTSLYYIAPAASGSGRALWTVSLNELGQLSNNEFIEGVDDMQLEYGEDTDADGVPNGYVTANSVSAWKNVVSVRISLLMSTLTDNQSTALQTYEFNGATVTATDRRVRRSFSSVVNLRNRTL
jgi:type IV pilus assembly protein PilW